MDPTVDFTTEPRGGGPAHISGIYMTAVGGINWLANTTRSDLAFVASQLSTHVADPGPAHCKALLGALLYIRETSNQSLTFAPNGKPLDVCIRGRELGF